LIKYGKTRNSKCLCCKKQFNSIEDHYLNRNLALKLSILAKTLSSKAMSYEFSVKTGMLKMRIKHPEACIGHVRSEKLNPPQEKRSAFSKDKKVP
jgi:hypothetical protein